MRPAWARLLDALAMTLLVIAGAHEAWIWLGGQGWLGRLPQFTGNESARVVGIVFGCAAAYGIYMAIRSWRRVG